MDRIEFLSGLPSLTFIRKRLHLSKNLFQVGHLFVRNILTAGVGILVISVITSILSTEQFGTYRFAIGIVSSLAFLGLQGLNTVIMQETAKGRHGVLNKALRLRLKASVVYTAVLLAIACYYYFVAGQHLLAFCIASVSFFFPLSFAFDSYKPYLLGLKEYIIYSRLPVFESLISAVFVISVAWIAKNPIAILFSMVFSQCAIHLIFYRLILRLHPPQNKDYSSTAMSFGLKLSAINTFGCISSQMDTILTGMLLTMSDVAILRIATLPLVKLKELINVLVEYVSPHIVSHSGHQLFKRAKWAIIALTIAVIICTALIAMALPWFFNIFFPKYVDVVPLAVLALFSMVVSMPTRIIQLTLFTEERSKQIGYMRTIQFVFDIIILFVMLKIYGVMGAIISRYLAGILWTIMNFVVYLKNRRETPTIVF